MKKILISILIIITGVVSLTVKAEEKKVYELILPSNGIDSIEYKLNSTILDNFMINPILMNSYIHDDVIVNQNGKAIIRLLTKDNAQGVYFQLLDGVTKEDCLLEITDDMLSAK